MKVMLIGCGKTGSSIIKNLNQLNEVDEVVLYSLRTESSINLQKKLGKKARVLHSLENLDKNLDYIIVTISALSRKQRKRSFKRGKDGYQMREDELGFNLSGMEGLLEPLKKVSKKTKIIVVTNPVEEMANFLVKKLKNKNVYSFGLELDAKRYSKVLKKPTFCIGPHGHAVPLIDSKVEKSYEKLYFRMDGEFIKRLRKKGIQHKFVGLSFLEYFEKLTSKEGSILHIGKYLDQPFLGERNILVSLPWVVRNGKLIKVADIDVNNFEKKHFKALVKDLRKNVKKIV